MIPECGHFASRGDVVEYQSRRLKRGNCLHFGTKDLKLPVAGVGPWHHCKA